MRKQYHILNGDALKENFPRQIEGEIIVARECLMDGDVMGESLAELFAIRAKFLSQNYGGSEEEYYEKTVPEFLKIESIEDDADINLWFEDDLFCQVNLWFVSYLISKQDRNHNAYLVRPEIHTQYGFGGLSQRELISIYEHRIVLQGLDKIGNLWQLYQNDDTEGLISLARKLTPFYSFILPAVEAHIERRQSNNSPGRPIQTLIAIMSELNTEEFDLVFREFCKREAIYGYGDVQVKRLFDELIDKE